MGSRGSAAVVVDGDQNLEDERLIKMKKMIWVFGASPTRREALKAALSGFDVRFLSIKASVETYRDKVGDIESSIFARYAGTSGPGFEEFVQESGVDTVEIEPIDGGRRLPGAAEDGDVVGFRIVAAGQTRAGVSPPLAGPADEAERQDLAWRAAVALDPHGAAGLLKLPALSAPGRIRVFVIPRAGWMERHCSAARVPAFVDALQRACPNGDFVLQNDGPADLRKAVAGGGLRAVIYQSYKPAWPLPVSRLP